MEGRINIHLNPTSLSQFIRLENCERFLRFRLVPEDLKRLQKKWNLTIQPLTPLLKESGADFEENIAKEIAVRGETVIDLTDKDTSETIRCFQSIKYPTILYQPSLEAPIGNFLCSGRGDIIRVSRDSQKRLVLLVADIKATRKEKTEHRVQVATYVKMIQQIATSNQIPLAEIKGSILTQQDDGSFPFLQADTPTFDLDTYLTIVDRLVVLPESIVNRIVSQPFEAAFYHLNYKCDGCLYNSICMYDAAEKLDVTLTPLISAVEKRVLNEAGVCTIQDLASLMDFPPEKQYEMRPSPAHLKTLNVLNNRWPVAPELPFLVQRAKAALHNFDKTSDYRSYLLSSGFGTLPSEVQYPDLIKIFFDAQRDYLQDRLYLISAHVIGPRGEKTIVCCSNQPPNDEIEGGLLHDWVRQVIGALRQVAARDEAPIHLYCYNRYDQKILLEALKRHLSEVAAMPAFYDLMTQSPALTQPIISFLSDEVQERLNIGRVCTPLHDVARWLRFDWKDDKYDYFQ